MYACVLFQKESNIIIKRILCSICKGNIEKMYFLYQPVYLKYISFYENVCF